MMTNIINTRHQTYVPPPMLKSARFLHWHCKTSAFTENPRTWSMEQLAESICEFDMILQETAKCNDAFQSKPELVISVFKKFIIDVTREAEIMNDENMHSTRIKIGKQKGQNRLQDNLDMTVITNDSFDINNCAYCKHRFVLPIGLTLPDINSHNSKVAKQHLLQMKKWSNTPVKRRGVKPRPNKSISQQLACLCTKMNLFR